MSSPAQVDVSDALDDLVNQFSDSMSFFRELIQNALDAGSSEVDVDLEFEPSAADQGVGAMVIEVRDYGEGMDREIIDSKLTRLFSSAKDGDMTKIGKFGIGFVSVFAIEPDAVCVDTARGGEAWRVLFDRQRKFRRLRLDEAIEGTVIRIIKRSTRAEFEGFVIRAEEVVRYWCRHARGEVRVGGVLISEPFGLRAPIKHSHRDEFSEIEIGHRDAGQTMHAYFNGGLTLVEAGDDHQSAIEALRGLCFKVSSPYLEHTLTRDDVIQDGQFQKVVRKLGELARGPLRARVFEALDAVLRRPRGSEADLDLYLYLRAALWHIEDSGGDMSRAERKSVCARAPSGQLYTWSSLRKAVSKADELIFCDCRTPLSDAAEAAGLPVVLTWSKFEFEFEDGFEDDDSLSSLCDAMGRLCGGVDRVRWLGVAYFMPLAPEPAERTQWEPLERALLDLLDDSGHKIAGCRFARFGASGSLLGDRVAVSQREFGALTPADEAATMATGLFSRRRVLVVDADHEAVRTALGLSRREPELAAYQLAKLFMLTRGSIAPELDSELAAIAMRARKLRCQKLPI